MIVRYILKGATQLLALLKEKQAQDLQAAQEADISELIRVYGNINQAHKTGSATDGVEQHKAYKSDDILALEIKMIREQQACLDKSNMVLLHGFINNAYERG